MRNNRAGFTIIELLIVLAIAGMIIIIVFLAVPALQRNSRNHQRKQDASRIISAINGYKGVNNTGLPGSCNNTHNNCFLRNVPVTMYDNQSTTDNNVSFWNRTNYGPFNDEDENQQLHPGDTTALTRISARSFTKCNGENMTGVGAIKDNIAVQFGIELGSGNVGLFCIEF